MLDPLYKRTKIVATIGPATQRPQTLRQIVEAGVNVARLNFSHGTHESHGATIADLRELSAATGRQLAVLADLPGPKVRTGTLPPGLDTVRLEAGQAFTLSTTQTEGSDRGVWINYAGLPHDVEPVKHSISPTAQSRS